jgi:ribosomal protein L12E/L44/L45/RPP1/RPP2
LFNAAAARSTTNKVVAREVDASQRKMEFIKKQNYTDKYTPADAKVTSYKLKCKVAEGVFCIIEYNISAYPSSGNNRVRVYKSYDTPTKINDSLVKKHGLFIGFGDGGDINFVSFFEIDENEFVTGITYKKDSQGKFKFQKDISPVNNKLVIKNQDQRKISSGEVSVDSKCDVFDDFTKQSFDFSLSAAAASYKLFLDDKKGLIAILVSDFKLPNTTDLVPVKRTLADEFTTIKEQVPTLLKDAMGFIATVEDFESYITSVRSSFRDVFKTQNAEEVVEQGSSSASETAPAAAAAPLLVLEKGGIAKYNDEKVFVFEINKAGYTNIKNKDKREFLVKNTALIPFMSAADVSASKKIGIRIYSMLSGLEMGCIAFMKTQGEYVYVELIDSIKNAEVLIKNGNTYSVRADSLISVMSARDVKDEKDKGVTIMDILNKFSSAAAAAAAAPAQPSPASLAASTLTIKNKALTRDLTNGGFNLITGAGISSTTSAPLTFISNDPNIASVDNNGDVTLNKVGTTSITVDDSNEKKEIVLKVIQSSKPKSQPPSLPTSPAPLISTSIGDIFDLYGTKYLVKHVENDGTIRGKTIDDKIVEISEKNVRIFKSASQIDSELGSGNINKTKSEYINDLLSGGKGKRRRSTRKYKKRRGRGNGNNGRRRLTRKVKGQSGGGGGARRGGKIHRKTKKRGRGGRRGRRGHRRTIKKYHRI